VGTFYLEQELIKIPDFLYCLFLQPQEQMALLVGVQPEQVLVQEHLPASL
jgi:hypothetical protein